jgi:hypothetical protein
MRAFLHDDAGAEKADARHHIGDRPHGAIGARNCIARSTKAAAPTATSTWVRRPAVRSRYCRSAPISVPSTKAVARLSNVSRKSKVWNVASNRMMMSCVQQKTEGRQHLARLKPHGEEHPASGASRTMRPTHADHPQRPRVLMTRSARSAASPPHATLPRWRRAVGAGRNEASVGRRDSRYPRGRLERASRLRAPLTPPCAALPRPAERHGSP